MLVAVIGFLATQGQDARPSIELLKKYMVGSYSSAAQHERDTAYHDLELEIRRIWSKDSTGIWLYAEQAEAVTKNKPLRQYLYRLSQQDDSTFIADICDLPDMVQFAGAYRDVARFNGVKSAGIRVLTGCALVLHWRKGRFIGGISDQVCRKTWGTVNPGEFDIGPYGMVSWDLHTNVHGTRKFGYQFVKRKPVKAAIPTNN